MQCTYIARNVIDYIHCMTIELNWLCIIMIIQISTVWIHELSSWEVSVTYIIIIEIICQLI